MRLVGRYLLHGEIAAGGMAVVHAGRLLGPVGFARTVAIKRLRDQFAQDPEFVSMLLDEARLAARIQHTNVVSTLDIVALKGELLLVMEYVHGVALSKLIYLTRKARETIDLHIVVHLVTGVLFGLHAAHEARRENGEPLNMVHRDVNAQNVIVGVDGVARVLDFGIAKASFRYQHTGVGMIKGRVAHMAPEHIAGEPVDRRADIYAASLVLWELLTLHKLFQHDDPKQLMSLILAGNSDPPSAKVPGLPPALDHIILRGLARDPNDRWPTAHEMAVALENAVAPATPHQVGEWVRRLGCERLQELSDRLAAMERAVANVDVAPAVDDEPCAHLDRSQLESGTPAAAVGSAASTGSPASLASASPAPRSRISPLIIVAGVAPVVLAVAVLLWFFLSTRGVAVAVVDSVPSTAVPGSAVVVVVPAPSTAASDVPSVAPPASSDGAGTDTVPAAPQSASAAPAKSLPASPPPQKRSCRPPYTIGPDGVKRYKPECF